MDDPLRPVPASVCGRLRSFLIKLSQPAAIWCEDDHLARMVCDLAVEAGVYGDGAATAAGRSLV